MAEKRLKKLLPNFMKTQTLFVQDINWNEGWAQVIETDQHFFHNAMFLDKRVLKEGRYSTKIHLKELNVLIRQQWDRKILPCHFIFHLGHAGSTLISRLLDECPGVFGMREPVVIRPIAITKNLVAVGKLKRDEETMQRNLHVLYLLLTRRFNPGQTMVMKTTSICANLAPDLLGFHPENRGLVLSVTCEVNLANQMDKEKLYDIQGFSLHRQCALQKREPGIEIDLNKMSRAELIALNWMGEVLELHDLITGSMKNRVLAINFDDFLKDKATNIKRILTHFSLPHDMDLVEKLCNSQVFQSYAKKPDFEYTVENRASILTESRIINHRQIKEGLDLIKGWIERFPSFARAVDYFGLQ